jgi:hypothetical protein
VQYPRYSQGLDARSGWQADSMHRSKRALFDHFVGASEQQDMLRRRAGIHPIPAVRPVAVKGSFGVRRRQRFAYLGRSLTLTSSAAHPQHLRERHPRIGPVPHQRLGPARLAPRAISVKDPPNPNYTLYASGEFFASQRSAAFFVAQSPGNKRLILSCLGSACQPRRPILSGCREKPAFGGTALA